jgi:hypothetical protein
MAEKEKGEKKEQKTNNRGITSPDIATIALLNIWNDEEIKLSLENTNYQVMQDIRATDRIIMASF